MSAGFEVERTYTGRGGDTSLLAASALLFGTGLAVLYSASYGYALSLQMSAAHFLLRQLGYAPLALMVFLACAFLPAERLKSLVKPLTLLALAALVLPFIPGIGVSRNGATRWIGIGSRTFQPSQIFRIALPISLAILIPQLNFIINNIFLGHYNGDAYALAVAGITGVYYLIFAAIGYGLNNGLQALIARRAGENRPEEIGKLFTQGVLIGLLVAVAGIIITWVLTPAIFSLIIHDPAVQEKAVSFLRIRIWGLPFLYIYQLRNALLVGTNQSRYLVAGTLAETL
ncbi:MAG TPA: MATE family efflux transporter, partial [Bacteroidales bacterium]|nr:MATE family efflux transporter [Bacteroidales bacterium]